MPADRTSPGATSDAAALSTPPHGTKALRRFLPFLRPVRGTLAAGLIASALQAVFQWLSPWPLQMVFDNVLNHLPLPSFLAFMPASPDLRLAILSLAMVVIALGLAVFGYGSTYLIGKAGQGLVYGIRIALFTHLERQSLAFHERRTTGDLMSRLSGDAQALQNVMVGALPSLVNSLFTLAGITVIMLIVDWRFALLVLGLVPLLHLSMSRFMGGLKSSVRAARRQEGAASTVAQEVLTSIAAVQVFGREADEADRFAQATSEGLEANRRAIAIQSALTTTASTVMALGVVPIVFLGALAIINGDLTAGKLLVFTAYLRATYTPIRQLTKLAIVFGQGLAASERLAELLDAADELPDGLARRAGRATRGHLEFDRVGFRYAPGVAALADVRLEVPPGGRLAIVGATGSGKSTLVRLIPRFYDPTAGAIRLDGMDLRDLPLAELRRQVGMVTQEPYIFRGTVWENIAYGAAGTRLSRQEAIDAAKAAGVDSVLERLSEGYDTPVSERGATLSGGQRQAISMARAMARDPRVLILDEPTTGLDAGSEAQLLHALDRLARGRTTIIVSHQLGAVRTADRIAVLDRGRVVELGTHQALLRARGRYWRLHEAQRGNASSTPSVFNGLAARLDAIRPLTGGSR